MMYTAEQIAELDERIRKAKYELEAMQCRRDRMMKERWKFRKLLRIAKARRAAEKKVVE